MWPFANRGARAATIAPPPPQRESLDYPAFAHNDAVVKVWLPDKLTAALDLISARTDTSRPDVLRAILFEHVYGQAELARLEDWHRRKPTTPPVDTGIKYSEKRDVENPAAGMKMLGKSVIDLKLWLPAKLKLSLADLASAEDLGQSDYIRKILVYRLLGEKFHRAWQAAIGRVPIEYRELEQQP
jgi:hypothetical protein